MKKKSESRIKKLVTGIINIRAWCDWDRMKALTLYLLHGIKILFIPQKPENTEKFELAKKRLNLNEKELLAKQNGLLRLSILMISLAVCFLGYGIYLIIIGGYRGFVVSFVLMLIALTLAFRYHFWYFQIREHKLGCSIEQWFREGLLGEKK